MSILSGRQVRAAVLGGSAALVCLGSEARGQSIRGRVVDEQGTPVARAEVQVLPAGQPTFTDALGRFDLGTVSRGTHIVRVRRVAFDVTTIQVGIPLSDSEFIIVLHHSALALDTVHAIALGQALPRLFDRVQHHIGASLYGPALDTMFARGGSRDLKDMLTIDSRFASMLRRPHCGQVVAFVDGIRVRGNLQPDLARLGTPPKTFGMTNAGRKTDPDEDYPARIEQYISQKEIAAIEVFDSPDFVHEPFIDSDKTLFVPGSCMPIVLIWSKYYQQQVWAGH